MKTFGFALAAGVGMLLLNATPAAADEPTTAPAPRAAGAPSPAPIVTAGPVMMGDVVTTTRTRRGLFGRLRNRGTTTVAPVITTQPGTVISQPGTVITQPGTIVTPPATTPAPPIGVPTPMPRPGTTSEVIMTPTGTYVVADQTTTVRRGMFGRVRSRGTATVTPMAAMPVVAEAMPADGPIGWSITPTPPTDVVPASGTIVTADGTVISTDGVVTTAGYTTPVQTRRTGLFGRMRNR
jgi:hypothetical protein